MDQWMINVLILFGLNICSLVIGYAMGRNSAEKPLISEAQRLPFNQGSGNEPDEDLFRDAMNPPDDKRVATIKE